MPPPDHSNTAARVDELAIRNFKCLGNARFPIRRFNLLTGANSAGKSSVVQSILVRAQSRHGYGVELYGDLVRIGSVDDVLREGTHRITLGTKSVTSDCDVLCTVDYRAVQRGRDSLDLKPVGLKMKRFRPNARRGQIVLEAIPLSKSEAIRVARHANVIPVLESTLASVKDEHSTWLRASRILGEMPDRDVFILLSGQQIRALVVNQKRQRTNLDFVDLAVHAATIERWDGRTGPIAVQADPLYSDDDDHPWQAFLDETYNSDVRAAERARRSTGHTLDEVAAAIRVWVDLLHDPEADPKSRRIALRKARSMARRLAVPFHVPWRAIPISGNEVTLTAPAYFEQLSELPLPTELAAVLAQLEATARAEARFDERIAYLGPLREEPRVTYPSSPPLRNAPLGTRGERTPEVLLKRGASACQFVTPAGAWMKTTLQDATSIWAQELGIGSRLSAEVDGKHGIGIDISISGVDRKLTDIGVGASQLLPIVVLVLNAEPDTLIVIEQPELHLHPAVQARLADFFLVARPDINIVVETHSEYIITRTRLRVAEGLVDPDDVNLSFVERDHRGTGHVRRLDLDSFGGLSEWPSGFFEQAEEDYASLLAIINKRLQEDSKAKGNAATD